MLSKPMTVDDLSFMYMMCDYHSFEFIGNCKDCGKPVTVRVNVKDEDSGEFEITGGAIWKKGDFETFPLACTECYEKDPMIRDQECEVFARIVGYLRPIQGWNPGKKSEFPDRKMFQVDPENTSTSSLNSCQSSLSENTLLK